MAKAGREGGLAQDPFRLRKDLSQLEGPAQGVGQDPHLRVVAELVAE
jgi:hypothetical protein